MSDPNDYTVGWISASYIEASAAAAFLDDAHEPLSSQSHKDHNSYFLGRIGKHNVAIAVLPDGEPGIAAAADVANDMLHTFNNIRICVMVGVGGGAPSDTNDIRLGDVVVSSNDNEHSTHGGVFQYDYGRTIQGREFYYTGHLNSPPRALRTAATAVRSIHQRRGAQIKEKVQDIISTNRRLEKDFGPLDPATDRLYKSSVVHPPNTRRPCWNVCGKTFVEIVQRADSSEGPTVYYGLIASANQEMRNAVLRDKFSEEHGVLCFEREAAGLMNNFPCLVIRGICDYADTHQNSDWKGYAALTAAAYAKDLLSQVVPDQVEAERPAKPSSRPPPSGGNNHIGGAPPTDRPQPGSTSQPGGASQQGDAQQPSGNHQPSNTPQPGDHSEAGGSFNPGGAPPPAGTPTPQPGDTVQPGGNHHPSTAPQPGNNPPTSGAFYPGGAPQSGGSDQPSTTPQPGGVFQPGDNNQPGAATPQPSGNYHPITVPQPGGPPYPGGSFQPGGNYQPGITPQPGGNCQPGHTCQPANSFQPSPKYKERVGHFLKYQVDAAIARDKDGFEAALRRLVNSIDIVHGVAEAWRPLAVQIIDFQRAWQLTEPHVRDGRKSAQGIKWETWRDLRKDNKNPSFQRRFHAGYNELLAWTNKEGLDRDIGYASMERALWSVWRTMEYMGIAEDI
ncbi:nucleoside phosphorylase domain-containing protein [Annulohypoxylon moriforme]|nr:nucleoside phosphorylase domain-containing protein [Annulohypoxylon moriforme]